MLKKLTSIFISKKIFTYIDERKKLKIKYNKNLQKINIITLINYKLLSGKYVGNEQNGIVKEYNSYTDDLIYEGEYLNGKRHGKGKEYLNNKLIYEGEYLNGKRNGNGKNYFNENSIFEGVYLNN